MNKLESDWVTRVFVPRASRSTRQQCKRLLNDYHSSNRHWLSCPHLVCIVGSRVRGFEVSTALHHIRTPFLATVMHCILHIPHPTSHIRHPHVEAVCSNSTVAP